MLTENRARKVAGEWHSGQWSPLYAMSSSGFISRATLKDIDTINPTELNGKDVKQLNALREFVAHVLEPRYMQNRDGDFIAAKFLQHKVSGTGVVDTMNGNRTSRLVTDGNKILSYEWWEVAHWIDDSTLAITVDNYRYQNRHTDAWVISPTTAAHIGSIHYAAIAAGFHPTEELEVIETRATPPNGYYQTETRTFRLYRKG